GREEERPERCDVRRPETYDTAAVLPIVQTPYFSRVDDSEPPMACVICGRQLGDSDDDQPDWPTGPMCGDCYQARETDNDIWASELNGDEDAETA
ncbi:MAG: hypothetical protein QOJ81_1094, partial [Chloroflexota bacterium]|nr:hypothetical protein [Chloroflexota bacterium]